MKKVQRQGGAADDAVAGGPGRREEDDPTGSRVTHPLDGVANLCGTAGGEVDLLMDSVQREIGGGAGCDGRHGGQSAAVKVHAPDFLTLRVEEESFLGRGIQGNGGATEHLVAVGSGGLKDGTAVGGAWCKISNGVIRLRGAAGVIKNHLAPTTRRCQAERGEEQTPPGRSHGNAFVHQAPGVGRSIPRREYPLQRDAKIYDQIRLNVWVGLAAARGRIHRWIHGAAGGTAVVQRRASGFHRRITIGGTGLVATGNVASNRMGVLRHLVLRQGHVFTSAYLAQDVRRKTGSLPHVYRHRALQVRQREGSGAVAAIKCSQKRKQGCILADREELAVAQRPPLRGKIESEHPYLTEKWFCHN